MSAAATIDRSGAAAAGAKIVAELGPILAPMIEARLAELVPLPAPGLKSDEKLMRACRAVGEACDRLEQTRFSKAEIGARRALEIAAGHLRAVMRARGAF